VKKWQNGRRGQDGWGRYTRRRKWYRDAELVEVTPSTEITPSSTPAPPEVDTIHNPETKSSANTGTAISESHSSPPKHNDVTTDDSSSTRSSLFRPGILKRSSASGRESLGSERTGTGSDRIEIDEAEELPGHQPLRPRDGDWGIGDEARMGLE
jgi:hypothetical protein